MVGGSWFERGVCSCLHHVEAFDMSHDCSRSLGCKSWDNAGQGDGHNTLNCVGNKTVPMCSPQCDKNIPTNTGHSHVMGMSWKGEMHGFLVKLGSCDSDEHS